MNRNCEKKCLHYSSSEVGTDYHFMYPGLRTVSYPTIKDRREGRYFGHLQVKFSKFQP